MIDAQLNKILKPVLGVFVKKLSKFNINGTLFMSLCTSHSIGRLTWCKAFQRWLFDSLE